MAKVPFGNAARATRRVASGIGCSSSGRNDIRLLLPALVGAREQPNRSADQGPAEFATSVDVGPTPGWRVGPRSPLGHGCRRRVARPHPAIVQSSRPAAAVAAQSAAQPPAPPSHHATPKPDEASHTAAPSSRASRTRRGVIPCSGALPTRQARASPLYLHPPDDRKPGRDGHHAPPVVPAGAPR